MSNYDVGMEKALMIDAISRSAVIEALEMRKSSFESMPSSVSDMIINAFVMCKTVVETAPAIDAVPVVHGHWIKVLGGNGLVSTIRCSECGNCDNPSYIPGNYCWFCGARMDGGKDDEKGNKEKADHHRV